MNIYKRHYRFYVYAYLRGNLTPYYIGKGEGNRAFSHNHVIKPPKDKTKILFLEKNLSDIGALALERRMIKWYGRIDIQTGILRNKTDGGDGCAGRKMSKETIKKAITTKRLTGGIFSAGTKNARNKATKTRLENNDGKYNTQTPVSIRKGLETKKNNNSLKNSGGWNKSKWKLVSPKNEILFLSTKEIFNLNLSLYILKSNIGQVVTDHYNIRSVEAKNTIGWTLIEKLIIGRK